MFNRLVCFNNFYYCRYAVSATPSAFRLVCFNNFYYCRYKYKDGDINPASMLQ